LLLGTLKYFDETFIFMETSFTKGSRQFILVSELDLTEKNHIRRTEIFYRGNGILENQYIIGILDPTRKKQYGSIQLLDIIYRNIVETMRKSRLEKTYRMDLGEEIYESGNSLIRINCGKYEEITLKSDSFTLTATLADKLNIKPRTLGQLLVDAAPNSVKYNTATFIDASMEYLERMGFSMSWMENKEYIPIHSVEDWDNLLIPAFIKEFTRWKKEKDFEYFLVSFDWESTGLLAFGEKAPVRDHGVFFSVSFKDNQSFGVFIDMENFQNADREAIAERVTYLTQIDPLVDRDIVLSSGILGCEFKRSEITVEAHNAMIDRRFAFTMGADFWFDMCTNQLSFNLDPFMTRGLNGLKYNVDKTFGIVYADLGDICGKRNMGMFRYLSDKRVVMMYGCADTDLHRLWTKTLIIGIKNCTEYYGVDHVAQHLKIDALYMNSKADNDYQGMRINYDEFERQHTELNRVLNLYYDFMSQYVGRVQEYMNYQHLVMAAERSGVEISDLRKPNLDAAPPYHIDKWTGNALLKVLFEVLTYPKLVWTTQNKKAKLAGKAFTPQPAVNVDAIEYYLQYKSTVPEEQIEKALEHQESLEELKWASMYLKSDYVDPVTKKVLISKKEFNSFRLPFFQVLLKISPLIKTLTSELNPVVENKSNYKFAICNTTSAVTRRDLNPLQTVSGEGKYHYLPYDEDYNNLDVDQSAVEIRILYGISGDENLIKPINNPEKDCHTETAALMHQRPAYTIDKKTRKGIKFLAFGRPYGKEVYSSCRDFYGDTSPEHMAEMAYLFSLYDDKLASVMEVLSKVRDAMDIPVDAPEWLRWHLEMDPDKKYGRMINAYGYTQHMEIREGDEGFRQAMRRKAGNFIIQGFAANFIRQLYVRLLKALWKRGWIQNRLIRLHLTVHDEILFSYHKSLNPVEVMIIVHEALTVQIKGFPTFFVGINFGHNWGEAKDDNSELPVLLVKELQEDFKAGKYQEPLEIDHIEFFKEKKRDYIIRRVTKELKAVNENKNVWHLEKLSDMFTNYTVRAMLPDAVSEKFPVPKKYDPGSIALPKDCEDPILILSATLFKFIAKHIQPGDSRTHHVVYKKQAYKIQPEMATEKYANLEDLLNNRPIASNDIPVITQSEPEDIDVEVDFSDEGFGGFDFNPQDSDKEYDEDGIMDYSSDFLLQYNKFEGAETKVIEYGSIEARVHAEAGKGGHKYNNFKIQNGSVILHIGATKLLVELRKFCADNTTSSLNSVKVYAKHGGQLLSLGQYTQDFLTKLDDALSRGFKKTTVG
jgi:hypothetical protein